MDIHFVNKKRKILQVNTTSHLSNDLENTKNNVQFSKDNKKKRKKKKRVHKPITISNASEIIDGLAQQNQDEMSSILFNKPNSEESESIKHKLSKRLKKKRHQWIISRFHALQKQLDYAKSKHGENSSQVDSINQQIDKMGGLRTYQQMSLKGEQLHSNANTSKWILNKILDHELKPTEVGSKLSLLDVGALHFNYKQNWIDCKAIDLNPVDSGVQRQDFFEIDEEEFSGFYDIVCLSLVLNFVGDVKKRGMMLIKCFQILKTQGHLFIVLPLPCIRNSRYCTHELFVEIMDFLGFEMLEHHQSKKLSYYMFKKESSTNQYQQYYGGNKKVKTKFQRTIVQNGLNRNNFCVVL